MEDTANQFIPTKVSKQANCKQSGGIKKLKILLHWKLSSTNFSYVTNMK